MTTLLQTANRVADQTEKIDGLAACLEVSRDILARHIARENPHLFSFEIDRLVYRFVRRILPDILKSQNAGDQEAGTPHFLLNEEKRQLVVNVLHMAETLQASLNLTEDQVKVIYEKFEMRKVRLVAKGCVKIYELNPRHQVAIK